MDDFKSIKNWAVDERPVEKLVAKGSDALTNAELLTILINTGSRNRSALDIAKDLLEKGNQSLLELSKFSLADFKKIKGIGEKKAVTIVAALEIGKRRQLSQALERPRISNSKSSYEILVTYFLDIVVEQFYVMYLSNNNAVLAVEKMSEGGMTATMVDARVIFKRALEINGTTKIVLAHNHPSGNLTPSQADKLLTQRMKEAGKFLEFELLDHVIVGHNQYFSFADEGLI
jgi:DNA repair protein RadC